MMKKRNGRERDLELERLKQTLRREWERLLEDALRRIQRLEELIERLLDKECRVVSFRIKQTHTGEHSMAITGITPGSTGTFTATPLNAAGQPVDLTSTPPPVPAPPVWTSSDTLAVVTAAADGLSASVAVDATAPQGGNFTLTVAQADGSASTSVTVPYNTVTPPPPPPPDNVVASFGINQTS